MSQTPTAFRNPSAHLESTANQQRSSHQKQQSVDSNTKPPSTYGADKLKPLNITRQPQTPSKEQKNEANQKSNQNQKLHEIKKNWAICQAYFSIDQNNQQNQNDDEDSLNASFFDGDRFLKNLDQICPPMNSKKHEEFLKVTPQNIEEENITKIFDLKKRIPGIKEIYLQLQKYILLRRSIRKERKIIMQGIKNGQNPYWIQFHQNDFILNPIFQDDSEDSAANDSSTMKKFQSLQYKPILDILPSQLTLSISVTSILLRLEDIFQKKEAYLFMKQSMKEDIRRLIHACIQSQKCVFFKLPFFVLNFMLTDELSTKEDRLNFLKMITKKAQTLNTSLKNKIFLILVELISPIKLQKSFENQKLSQSQMGYSAAEDDPWPQYDSIIKFIGEFLEMNPHCFTISQNLILLTRVCRLAFICVSQRASQTITTSIIQIINQMVKSTSDNINRSNEKNEIMDYRQKIDGCYLHNLAIMALSILVNQPDIKDLVWTIVITFILMDPDRILFLLIDLLRLDTNLEPSNTSLKQELDIKCFNQLEHEFQQQLDDLENEIECQHRSCMLQNFEEIDTELTIDQMLCCMSCPKKFTDKDQAFNLVKMDQRQFTLFKKRLSGLREQFVEDRRKFVEELAKRIAQVKQGCIFFIAMAKFGQDRNKNIGFSNQRILEVFQDVVLKSKPQINVISEIISALRIMVRNENLRFGELEKIMDIIQSYYEVYFNLDFSFKQSPKDLNYTYSQLINENFKSIEKVFKKAIEGILLGKYHGSEQRIFFMYIFLRNYLLKPLLFSFFQKTSEYKNLPDCFLKPNYEIIAMYIDTEIQNVLQEDINMLEQTIKQILDDHYLNEPVCAIQRLTLNKVLQYFLEQNGNIKVNSIISNCLKNAIYVHQNRYTTFQLQNQIVKNSNFVSVEVSTQSEDQLEKIKFLNLDILSILIYQTVIPLKPFLDAISFYIFQPNLQASKSQFQTSYLKNELQSLTVNSKRLQMMSLQKLIDLFKITCLDQKNKSEMIWGNLLDVLTNDSKEKKIMVLDKIIEQIRILPDGIMGWQERMKVIPINIQTINVQDLFVALIIQVQLTDDGVLEFKIKCLRVVKRLVLDILKTNIDHFHGVLGQLCVHLLNSIDFLKKFECSQEILDILGNILQIQDLKFLDKNNGVQKKVSDIHIDYYWNLLDNLLNQIETLSQKSIESIRYQLKDLEMNNLSLITLQSLLQKNNKSGDSKTISNAISTNYFDSANSQAAIFKKYQINSENVERKIQVLRKILSILALVLKQQSQRKFLIQNFQQRTIQETFKKNDSSSFIFRIIQLVYSLVCLPELFHLLTFSIVELVEGLTVFAQELKDVKINNSLWFILFKMALPKLMGRLDKNFQAKESMINLQQETDERSLTESRINFRQRSSLDSQEQLPSITELKNEWRQFISWTEDSHQPEDFKQTPYLFLIHLKQIPDYQREVFDQMQIINNDFLKISDFFSYTSFRQSQKLKNQKFQSNKFQQKSFQEKNWHHADLLIRINDCLLDLFSFNKDFRIFKVVQEYLKAALQRISTILDRHKQITIVRKDKIFPFQDSPPFEQIFIQNLIDNFHWDFNCVNSMITKHLRLQNSEVKAIPQFYLMNNNFITIMPQKNNLEFLITVRNAVFNFQQILQYQNQLHIPSYDNHNANRNSIQQFIHKNTLPNNPKPIPNEINHEILFQAIDPLTVNKFKTSFQLKNINQQFQQIPIEVLKEINAELDIICPYRVSIFWVSTLYTDVETALDFLSRVGELIDLRTRREYFTDIEIEGLSLDDQQERMAVVYQSKNSRTLHVYLSDFFFMQTQQNQSNDSSKILFNLKKLFDIMHLILLGSTEWLRKETLTKEQEQALLKQKMFLTMILEHKQKLNQFDRVSRFYRVNENLYCLSDNYKSKGSQSEAEMIYRMRTQGTCDPYENFEIFTDVLQYQNDPEREFEQNFISMIEQDKLASQGRRGGLSSVNENDFDVNQLRGLIFPDQTETGQLQDEESWFDFDSLSPPQNISLLQPWNYQPEVHGQVLQIFIQKDDLGFMVRDLVGRLRCREVEMFSSVPTFLRALIIQSFMQTI